MTMNTVQGDLTLSEALDQLRGHYESKRETDPPGSGLTDAALAALAALEWRVRNDGVAVGVAVDQLREHYARKMREAARRSAVMDQLVAALGALNAVEWHAGRGA